MVWWDYWSSIILTAPRVEGAHPRLAIIFIARNGPKKSRENKSSRIVNERERVDVDIR